MRIMSRRTIQVRHSAQERRSAWNNNVVKHGTIETATAGRCCLDRLVRLFMAQEDATKSASESNSDHTYRHIHTAR
jgi:hypothetical protein